MKLFSKVPLKEFSDLLEETKYEVFLYSVGVSKNWGFSIVHRVKKAGGE